MITRRRLLTLGAVAAAGTLIAVGEAKDAAAQVLYFPEDPRSGGGYRRGPRHPFRLRRPFRHRFGFRRGFRNRFRFRNRFGHRFGHGPRRRFRHH